jgi:hypothetical protein
MILFAAGFLFLFFVTFLSMTSKTIISDDEISSQSILGTKILRWSEIHRVSGRGYGIKLHNFDGDVTVSPSQRLPRYEEVIEWIGVKRPDLFSPQEFGEMTKSWVVTIFLPMLGLLFMGIAFFFFIQSSDALFPLLIFFIIGLLIIGMTLTSPQAISIQGNSIVIGYLFKQRTLPASEITSINLRYTQTRNGKQYYVALDLSSRSTIRISGLSPSLPIVYLVLKNWHRKNVGLS